VRQEGVEVCGAEFVGPERADAIARDEPQTHGIAVAVAGEGDGGGQSC